MPAASNRGGDSVPRHVVSAVLAGLALLLVPAAASAHHHGSRQPKHIVVIYEENHSFDNLYGGWERVDGLSQARPSHTTQVNQAGQAYRCLLQNDVNLTSPPLSSRCTDTTTATTSSSHFFNRPFTIDRYIKPTDKTCPPPGVFAPHGVLKDSPGALEGGCTEDIVHRFYQEQYQLNGG